MIKTSLDVIDTDHTFSDKIYSFSYVHTRPVLEHVTDCCCTIDKPHVIFTPSNISAETKKKFCINEIFGLKIQNKIIIKATTSHLPAVMP
jgi:hypothetical protein